MNKFIILLLVSSASLAAAGVLDRGHIVPGNVGGIVPDMNRLDTDRILRMSRTELLRQKFLLDVLQHVHQPLVNDELLRLADTMSVDQDQLTARIDDEILHVMELIRNRRLLGKDEIFTITDEEHLRQMIGIYRLLVSARDWDTFQRIVSHIRKYGNGVLMVNALLLAIRDRGDTQQLIVPGIHEILPEVYNDADIVRKVEQIDLSNLISNTQTMRPGLVDVIGLGSRTRMMNRNWGLGMGIGLGLGGRLGDVNTGAGMDGMGMLHSRSHLWMPWREIHMKMAMQRSGLLGDDNRHIVTNTRKEDKLVVALTNERVGQTTDETIRTLLTEDLGLKDFLHGLVNDLILKDAHLTRDNMDINMGRREQMMAERLDDDSINNLHRNERTGGVERSMNRWDDMQRKSRMDVDRMDRLNLLDQNGHSDRLNNDMEMGDTLPTTNINNDRLLHVNRRRMQMNTMQGNRGLDGGERTMFNDQRNRFMNVVRGGWGIHEGLRVADRGIDSNDMRIRWNMNQNINDDDDLNMRRNDMIDRSDRWTMEKRRVDDDDILQRRRVLLNSGMNLNDQNRRNMQDMDMLNKRRMDMDLKMDNSGNLPITSVNNERLVHVNQRRLNQKISMEENLRGQQQQIRRDDDIMGMQQGRGLSNIRDTEHILSHRDTILNGGRVHDDRRTVDREDEMHVENRRNSIRRDNSRDGRVGGRWNQDIETGNMWRGRNDDDMGQMRRSIMNGRGMENIGGVERDIDLDQWQRKRDGMRRQIVSDEDEMDLIDAGMRRRVTRSLDRMDRDMRSGADVQNRRHIMEELRGGEVLLHNLQQLIARMNLETIALGITDVQGDINENIDINMNRRLNNEHLVNNAAQMHMLRMNEMRMSDRRDRQMLGRLSQIEQRLIDVITQEIGRITAQQEINARDTSIINGIIGDILMGKVDHRVSLLNILRDLLRQSMGVRGVPTISDVGVAMQDPVIRNRVRRIMKIIDIQRQQLLGQYKRHHLELEGVKINDVTVDKLRTTVDDIDSDLINLLDARMNLNDNQELLQKTIVGRQQRINHKNFNINIDLTSDRDQRVVVRTLLVPKVDATGRDLTVDQQRLNAIVLDAQLVDLVTGRNLIKRKSKDVPWTTQDTTTLTEMYKRVMLAIGGNQDMINTNTMQTIGGTGAVIGHTCRFPHRLLLPRGRTDGLPMQMLVIVTGVEDIDRNIQMITGTDAHTSSGLLCGMGVGSQNLDRLPLRFPLDRQMDNIDQLQALTNVHLMDVKIYHESMPQLDNMRL